MADQPSTYSLKKSNDDNLELFSFIWFDTKVHIEENQSTIAELRSIINHTKLFHNGEECKHYIERRSKHDRIVLITNSQLARQVVPSIHEFRQVSGIFVRSTDKKTDEQWARNFTKVSLILKSLTVNAILSY